MEAKNNTAATGKSQSPQKVDPYLKSDFFPNTNTFAAEAADKFRPYSFQLIT